MNDLVNNYRSFLDNGKTERECVNEIVKQAEKAGYKDVTKVKGQIKPGDKVYKFFKHKQVSVKGQTEQFLIKIEKIK